MADRCQAYMYVQDISAIRAQLQEVRRSAEVAQHHAVSNNDMLQRLDQRLNGIEMTLMEINEKLNPPHPQRFVQVIREIPMTGPRRKSMLAAGWDGPGWYFWDETQTHCHGPFDTYEEASSAMRVYSETL